jgi:hypothetical protein
MNEHQEPTDDAERAVVTLLAEVAEVANSCPSTFTAADVKVSAVRRQPSRAQRLDRYRRPAWAWLVLIAVLALVLVFGVRLTTLSTPRHITPAGHPFTKTAGPPHPTTTSPKRNPTSAEDRARAGRDATTSEKRAAEARERAIQGSRSTSTTITPSTSTTVAGLLPVFLAPGYDGRNPVDIYLSGDAGNIVTNLEWSSWSGVEAVGHGTSNQEGCVPDCASGTQTPEPTTIILSDPVDGHYSHMTEMREGETEIFTYPPSVGHLWAEEAYNTPPT